MPSHCFPPLRLRLVAGSLTIAALLMSGGTPAHAQEYGVSVKIEKPAALAKVRTYSWLLGHKALDKAVDGQIRAAIDRELATHGLTRSEPGQGDVEVTYHSLTRVDVDLKTKAPAGQAPSYSVGTLVIDLLAKGSREPLFRVRVDKPIDNDREKLARTIDEVVAAMFQKYPGGAAKK